MHFKACLIYRSLLGKINARGVGKGETALFPFPYKYAPSWNTVGWFPDQHSPPVSKVALNAFALISRSRMSCYCWTWPLFSVTRTPVLYSRNKRVETIATESATPVSQYSVYYLTVLITHTQVYSTQLKKDFLSETFWNKLSLLYLTFKPFVYIIHHYNYLMVKMMKYWNIKIHYI